MKKLLITNAILLLLVLCVFISGYYFFSYHEDIRLTRLVKEAEWLEFSRVILIAFTISAGLAVIPVRRYRYVYRFLLVWTGLNFLLLSVLVVRVFQSWSESNIYIEKLVLEYRKKAEEDMRSGLIEIEYVGGLELVDPDLKVVRMNDEIDSLRRSYGFVYRNSGCVYSKELIKAQEKYVDITKPYLDKRNGPGWESKLEKQIEQIKNRYH